MKQWVTFILGFLSFLAVALMIIVIVAGNKPYSDVEQRAIERVKDENLLAEVKQAYVYANKQTSVTVIGTDAKGKLNAIFVPTGEGELKIASLDDAVTAKQARKAVAEEADVEEFLHTRLGMEKDGAVWEVAYKDKEDQLNYIYIMASDGKQWKKILNL
ncbi:MULTISPECIES: DUF5590 domain-containing protein [unclassified Planococcus (in: firmicutes)]|uniref:cell wall elongation regulator TseB-like domain-containing protein n=1 Tax=unclassified Planococcus (in: firmicutes) TaxID=2662419 RepID=UPI001F1C32B0|nr:MULTISPECIES: DUF5590 domain-containing protein [unclassified Planococcus (in: firmicutes)]UJF25647.1 DUF5590 domain-containing protein [Planococcus sp. 107-1]GKW44726.1 hypothetical protein NCCP2050_04180 [Planococcus sp. NCCP-2050]